ncbi:MAG: transposase DNA-binding-containing protein, partial [Deltaproteobacteria bacterium]|nr:transposase DNA-binding-containing protein [Deltaproteobacteria bacterium]
MYEAARQEARDWAHEEFGHAELGDSRRTARLVRRVASLAERPGGKVLDVFRSGAEQQAAYDFLDNEKVRSADILDAMQTAAVILDTTEAFTGERMELPVNVVEVREVGTTPSGEEPLHWRLLTNHPVVTARDIRCDSPGICAPLENRRAASRMEIGCMSRRAIAV